MGSFSIWHWLIVGIVLLLVFGGRGKVSDLMGDFAKGIKSFKKGLSDEDANAAKADAPMKTIDQPAAAAAEAPRRSEADSKVS
jgi:sec-independent protein translocase protein TatA